MGSEWPISSLGETCYITDGAHAKVERQSHGVLYLTSKNIGVGSLKLDKIDYISDADFQRLFTDTKKSQRRLRNGDVLTGIIGTFGNAYRYKNDDHFGISSSVAIFRPDPTVLDSDYLYYVITSKPFKATVEAYKGGSVQGYTNITTLKMLPIPLPDLHMQKRISETLRMLDDKIELNRQMNATLEAMAQALFKSWFVDFDPVIDNALAAGNSIPEPLQAKAEVRAALGDQRKPLPEEIQKQFPSRFVFSEEMGWIPEGWECRRFGDISEHVKDTIRTEDVVNYDFYVGLEHIAKKQIFLTENGSGESMESNKAGFDENDLLFGKLRPYFHKVCIAPQEGICSTDILVFRANKPECRSYMYLTAFTEAFVDYANMRSTGTRMPRASAKDMLNYVIAIPSEAVLKLFETITTPFWRKGIEAAGCSRVLAKLRDTLLPKLLSGELRIPDAEKLVADSV